MTLTTEQQALDALPGQRLAMLRNALSGSSWWTVSAGVPPAGATPPTGVGAVPTSATTGALPFVNPASGHSLYLAGLSFVPTLTQPSWAMVYDRLVHTSGLTLNTTAAQTVNSVSVPSGRDPNGEGAPWLAFEFYSGANPSGTALTVTASYTNQSGVSGQVATTTFTPVNFGAQAFTSCDLQSGDTGVRSVESVTCGAAPGAVNFGITLGRPLALIAADPARAYSKRDLLSVLGPVYPDSCLALVTSPTLSGQLALNLQLIEG